MSYAPPAPHPRRRPIGPPWWGMLWALLTLVFGGTALHQATVQPAHEVTFRIQENLQLPDPAVGDLNITQQTVERAAAQHGLRTYEPLTVEVVDRELTPAEQQGRLATPQEGPDAGPSSPADILLSMGEPDLFEELTLTPSTPVGVRTDFDDAGERYRTSRAIVGAVQRNITAGHGPGAVVAAGEMAGARLHGQPAPLPWAAAAAGTLGLTFFAFRSWYRRRAAHEALLRTLALAQQRLARVVLDLEALEVTYRAVEPDRLPRSVQDAWLKLKTTTRRMLEQQPALEEAVHRGDPVTEGAADPESVYPLEWFADDAMELTALANTLMESVSVHGGLAGSGRPLEQLLAPVHAAVRELETRLDAVLGQMPWTGPAGLTTADRTALSARLTQILQARGELLALADAGSADRPGSAPARLLEQWRQAERTLITEARTVSRRLRRREGRVILHLRDVRHLTERQVDRRLASHAAPQDSGLTAQQERVRLRETLGLPADQEERPLDALEAACLLARARLGDHPELDAGTPRLELPGPREDSAPVTAIHAPTQKRLREQERRRTTRSHIFWAAGVAAVLALAVGLGGWTSERAEGNRPFLDLIGEEQLAGLSIDDRTGNELDLTEAGLRTHLEDRFTEPVHLTFAVRDLGGYLYGPRHPERENHLQMDYAESVSALWTLKEEFPDLTDPVTGEMLPGQAILPVMVLPDDGYAVLPPLTGTLSLGDSPRLGAYDFQLTEPLVRPTEDARLLTYEIEGVARALQANEVYADQTDPEFLFWVIFGAVMILGIAALQILAWAGRTAAGLGWFGRHGARLRKASRRVDLLALDADDSRQSAVAVGDSQEEIGQRLFERTLVLALREVESLRMVPRAERLSQDYGHRVEMLERRVQMLEHWDQQTAERTEELLAAARQRW